MLPLSRLVFRLSMWMPNLLCRSLPLRRRQAAGMVPAAGMGLASMFY